MRKLIKAALVSVALTAGAPSVALASHTETIIAAAIGGAAGAFIGSNMGGRNDDGYPVRHVYIYREQPVERVVYVQPSQPRSVYYYADEPRYYNQRLHYRHDHHGRFRDGDDD